MTVAHYHCCGVRLRVRGAALGSGGIVVPVVTNLAALPTGGCFCLGQHSRRPRIVFDVRFAPDSDRLMRCSEVTRCAINEQSAAQQFGGSIRRSGSPPTSQSCGAAAQGVRNAYPGAPILAPKYSTGARTSAQTRCRKAAGSECMTHSDPAGVRLIRLF
jgi:hypothetical protein